VNSDFPAFPLTSCEVIGSSSRKGMVSLIARRAFQQQGDGEMFKEMAQIAAECFRTPRQLSVWSPKLGNYVCPDVEKEQAVVPETRLRVTTEIAKHPSINPQFKLVFLTSVIGTFMFAVLCLVLTFAAGKEPPQLFEKVIMGFFDLAKIGFGAVVGLLGGKKLQAEVVSAAR